MASVAVPVIVTVKGVVVPTVPLKVTTSVNFWPAVKVTGLIVGVTMRPVPPVIVEERVTGPVNPAAFTPADDPDGRLPTVNVSVVEAPDAKERLGPVGVTFEVVTLKSCGRTIHVIVFVLVPEGRVPAKVVRTVYEPTAFAGRRKPLAKVTVEEPEAPAMEAEL